MVFHTMMLGGLQKCSLIDYPGKVSCVIFLAGCNFSCPYCHNPDLIRDDPAKRLHLDKKDFYRFLEGRRGFLDGVVVSGGEPTLNGAILSFCQEIKAMGYPIKLDTNGSRPDVIRKLTEHNLIDYIALDIKTDPAQYPIFIKKGYDPESLLSSIQITMGWGGDYEFRTTCVRPFVDLRVIGKIGAVIQGASLYALQSFRDKELLHPEFFRNTEPGYDEDGMNQLKSAAEPWVKRCILR